MHSVETVVSESTSLKSSFQDYKSTLLTHLKGDALKEAPRGLNSTFVVSKVSIFVEVITHDGPPHLLHVLAWHTLLWRTRSGLDAAFQASSPAG